MKRTVFLLFFILLAAGMPVLAQGNQPGLPRFVEDENTLFRINDGQAYRFGYLEVPENRTNPESRMIRLPVFIFKSRNPDPSPDPVIYTVGGPGSSTLPAAPYMKSYRYLDDRDFILFEQRGTKYAQPSLDCPEWAEAIHLSGMSGWDQQRTDSLLVEAASRCRERLTGEGVDLNGYNTLESAADISDLVKALGIEEYNLLTISYSTKIAQVLMRDHPEGIRSVVMDSPLPLEVQYDEESVANLMEVTDRVLKFCNQDSACARRFPELRSRFWRFLEGASNTPLEIAIPNPAHGKEERFSLSGRDIISIIANASTSEMPGIALEIERMLNGDFSFFKENLAGLFSGPGKGAGTGMRLSVWCAEEHPFNDLSVIRKETTRYPAVMGLSPAVFSASVCAAWGVEPMPAKENQPVRSDIPVLLISGEFDHETPTGWAAAMLAHLPNSYHLVFPGWKHTPTTNWPNPCAMDAANAFFNNPENKPAPDCYTNTGKFRLKLDGK